MRKPASRRCITWAYVLLLAALAGCAPRGTPRQRLLGVTPDDPVERVLATPARMSVVYWPAIGACRPEEMAVLMRLEELGERWDDLRLLTVLPATWSDEERYGIDFPGEVVRLPDPAYVRQAAFMPLPRLEVWSAAGEPLLLKSLPPFGDPASLLVAEIEAGRALTAPLAEMAAVEEVR